MLHCSKAPRCAGARSLDHVTRAPSAGGGCPRADLRNATPVRTAQAGRTGVASGPTEQEMIMNQVTLTAEAFSKATRDAAAFGRGNLEAVAPATQAHVHGTQGLRPQ